MSSAIATHWRMSSPRNACVVNACDIDAVAKAHGEVFGQIRPAATMVAGVTMVDPKMLVEVEVDACNRG